MGLGVVESHSISIKIPARRVGGSMEWGKGKGMSVWVRTREEWKRSAGYIGLRVLMREQRAVWISEVDDVFTTTPSRRSH